MTDEETKRFIWSRCTEYGDCLLWDGAVDDCGVPQMRLPGSRKVEPVRRVLLLAMGRNIAGKLATTNCRNQRCMHEKHVVALTRKQLQVRSGKKLRGNPLRAAKLAIARRKTAKLDMEKVHEMRASGMNTRQAAAHYNVTQSTAAKVMRGEIWKDYSSPFAGLGERIA